MNRNYSLFPVLAGCLLLSLLYCPPVDIFYDDKEIFKYGGWLIGKGGVLYRDLFDHKPPLIFFFNYLGILLGPWGLWLLDTGLVLLATLLFFDLCRQHKLPYPWILPLLFNLMIRDNLACEGIGMTREYTAILLLLFFCIMLGKIRYKFFILGSLSALLFFMQQDQLLPLTPFLLFAFGSEGSVHVAKKILAAGLGFLSITLPLLAYFFLHGAMHFFWEDAFLFNFTWYTEKTTLGQHFRSIKDGLDGCNYKMAFIISTALGLTALFLQNKRKGLVFISLLAVALSLCPEYLSGKLQRGADFYYYFLPLAASLPILLFTVFAFTEDTFVRDKKSQLLYGALLTCSLFYTILQHATHLSPRSENYVSVNPQFRYLGQQHLKDGQLYVFQNSAFVYSYNQFRILSPSRWIYQHFWTWYPQWDANGEILKSIAHDLQEHKTLYVLDFSDTTSFRNLRHYIFWKDFLQKNYFPVTMTGPERAKQTLWKLK